MYKHILIPTDGAALSESVLDKDLVFSREIGAKAKAAGVPCETVQVEHDHPYETIIESAASKGCDLIAMASHGRRGISALVLGSETMKVLTHSTTSALVFR